MIFFSYSHLSFLVTLKTKEDLKAVISVCTKFAKYFLLNDQYKAAASDCCNSINQILKNYSDPNVKANRSYIEDETKTEIDLQLNNYTENVEETVDDRISQVLVFIWNGFVTYW